MNSYRLDENGQKLVEENMRLVPYTMGFSEHGSMFEWWHKKCAIEAAGMKYLHGVEAYLTATLDEKIRDNMHCVLIARNYDGFLELNKLVSASFNRNDNHFYYVPCGWQCPVCKRVYSPNVDMCSFCGGGRSPLPEYFRLLPGQNSGDECPSCLRSNE